MANYTQAVQQLYVAYYNRPGDPAGLAFWTGVVEQFKGDTSLVSADFASSAEYQAAYKGMDNRTVVNTVYRNLFGRDGEKGGLDYWAGVLNAKLVTLDSVVTAIASGAQGADLEAYNNKVKFASAFTDALDTHPEKSAYSGGDALTFAKALTSGITTNESLTAALAKIDISTAEFVAASKAPITFTLSANADTGVAFTGGGGDDTFNATGATFSAADSLKGGGGVNTLVINDDGAAFANGLPAQVKVENIQKINISTKGSVGGATAYDMSGFKGLEQVTVATTSGGVNLKLGDGARAVSIKGNTGAVTLEGKDLVSVGLIDTNQAATINNSTANHELSLALIGVGNAATITDANAVKVNLEVNAEVVGKGSNINLATAKATTLNINNSTAFQLTTTALAAADKLETLTLKGGGSFTSDLTGIASLTTIDASLAVGNNNWKVASIANLVFKGGSGADDVTLTGPLSSTAQVSLGAGDDRYVISHLAQSGAKVDGGAGKDVIVINDAALLGTGGAVVYSGFETLDFSSGKGLYDLDRVGEVTTLHTHDRLRGDVEFTNGRANSTIEMLGKDVNLDLTGKPADNFVVGQNIKFSLKDASGANDKLTVSMVALDGVSDTRSNGVVQANTVEANGIETITINSAVSKVEGTRSADSYVNSLTYLKAEGLKTLLVTGNATLDLHLVYSNTMTTLDASGSSGEIWFDGVVSTGTTKQTLNYIGSQGIDYYQSTASAVNFQGNGGRDTVLLYRYEKFQDVIKFAKASDSFITFAKDGKAEVLAHDTIFDFQTGVDKIDLSALKLANGANRTGFATINLASNTTHILQSTLKDGIGAFTDATGVNRSILWAKYGTTSGFVMIDVNGDGNYTDGTDMLFDMNGYAATIALNDFIF